jgi:hypothetical protein
MLSLLFNGLRLKTTIIMTPSLSTVVVIVVVLYYRASIYIYIEAAGGLNLVFCAPNLLPLVHYLTLTLCTKLAPL